MPESSCFRTPFESQRVHGSQTLLKSARQHFSPTFAIVQDKLNLKTSLLVRSKILGLFGNTLTADHMYSRHYWEKFPQHVQTSLYQKPKKFSQIFIEFLQSKKNLSHFDKKTSAPYLKYFRSYWLREMWLLECPKIPALEHPPRVNVFTGPKHCWNLHGSTFILIFK